MEGSLTRPRKEARFFSMSSSNQTPACDRETSRASALQYVTTCQQRREREKRKQYEIESWRREIEKKTEENGQLSSTDNFTYELCTTALRFKKGSRQMVRFPFPPESRMPDLILFTYFPRIYFLLWALTGQQQQREKVANPPPSLSNRFNRNSLRNCHDRLPKQFTQMALVISCFYPRSHFLFSFLSFWRTNERHTIFASRLVAGEGSHA